MRNYIGFYGICPYVNTLFRRCHLAQKLSSFVLNVSKSRMLCPLALTQLYFLVKYGHVPYT
ncbi:hypothetical protein Hanom_Chr11g00979221 [Helianthus anomalus]